MYTPLSVLWLELCLQVSCGRGGASLLKNETRLLHVPQGCWWGSVTCTEGLQDLAGRWAVKSPATCHDASGLCAQGSISPPQSQYMTTSCPQHLYSCHVSDLLHPLSSHALCYVLTKFPEVRLEFGVSTKTTWTTEKICIKSTRIRGMIFAQSIS